MSKQLIIISLENLPTRYTQQWSTHLPKVFQEKLGSDYNVIQIDGKTLSGSCTPGGFLDFESTNMWKSEQIISFFSMMKEGKIQDDAIILFTDFWHPGILQIKYTKDLCNKNWKIMSFVHCGSYQPHDPLGQLIEDKSWSFDAERAFYEAADLNVFATMDHLNFFHEILNPKHTKALRSGFPMEYIFDIPFPTVEKEDLVVFAARNSSEKHPEIFYKLAKVLPEYKFVNCQEEGMNKDQYHETLAKAKVVVSFAELETMGIVQGEALAANAIPLVPNHLCYPEEYPEDSPFLYPAKWIQEQDIKSIALTVKNFVENYNFYQKHIHEAKEFQRKNFFSCDILIKYMKENF